MQIAFRKERLTDGPPFRELEIIGQRRCDIRVGFSDTEGARFVLVQHEKRDLLPSVIGPAISRIVPVIGGDNDEIVRQDLRREFA